LNNNAYKRNHALLSMNNKFILTTSIVIVLILCLSIFAATMFLSKNNVIDQKTNIQVPAIQSGEYSQDSNQDNTACGYNYPYPCFIYPQVEQTKGDSTYTAVEQQRYEPCPTPKPVCQICKPVIEQERAVPQMKPLEQVRINC
jgi:hypothetical protein